jgi:adenylate cyclase
MMFKIKQKLAKLKFLLKIDLNRKLMTSRYRSIYNTWLFPMAVWLVIFFMYFISVWGMLDFMSNGILKDYLSSWYVYLELFMGSILFGLFFSLIDMISDRTFIRRKSFGLIILFKSLLYLVMVLVVFSLVFGTFYIFQLGPMENPENIYVLLTPRFLISYMAYFLFTVLLLNFIVQINRKLGPGNLRNLIFGKYHKPRDEYRIFLFLDLKGSTTIAEKLGHNAYSKLLRNCYHDLTDIVIRYNADIYQYVGDEVVLSWKIKDNEQTLKSVSMYFAFKERLEKRKEFYLKRYDTLPEFKGGMDLGVVTVAEIGDIKREIAYHGDVLNTAARIQDQCKVLNKDLLVSEHVEEKLLTLNGFKKEFIGDVNLRGKEKALKIYSLDEA